MLGPTGRLGDPPWQQFWSLLQSSSPIYQKIRDPESELKRKAVEPTKQSIFNLPKATWDVGTMFFVAESITARYSEFQTATRRFLLALKPGAPFVAAFMENSHGYPVGELRFPAVAISDRDVKRALRGIASGCEVHAVGSQKKFRDGYEGMMVVTGYRDRITDSTARDRPEHDNVVACSRARTLRPVRSR
jgi:hypothetical protein